MTRIDPGADGGTSAGGDRGPEQEFQLETRHLVLLIALVVVLCVASFMLGRWVERQNIGPMLATGGAAARGGADAKIEDAGDVSKDLTFFDTLQGNEPAPLTADAFSRAEIATGTPARPAQETPTRTATTPPGAPTGRRSVNEAVMIQVLVSKDRAAADALRKRLRGRGYTVVLVPDRGSYKVRVGPYADREEAERVARLLRDEEHLSTWIP